MADADDDDARTFSDPEAALALRRAAQLQLEAAERAERSAALGADASRDEGYGRQELLQAAREAGIEPQFVEVALAELGPQERALATLDEATERAATRWLGTKRRSISVSRVIEGSPEDVWAALATVTESEAWGLRLTGSRGGHPVEGGVANFAMMRLTEMVQQRRTYTQLCYRMEQLEAWSLRATLRDLGGRTEVTVYVDLREGVLANLKWARITTWLGSMAGGGAGFGLGLVAGFVAGGAFALVGGIAAAGMVSGSWRWAYRRAADQLGGILDQMLVEVQERVRRNALVGDAAG